MKLYTKKKKDNEYIAVNQKDKKYKIVNPFSEELKINSKKLELKILEDDNGFTYIDYKKKKYLVDIIEKSQNKYTVLVNGVSYSFTIESPISYQRKKYLDQQSKGNKIEQILSPMPGKIVDLLVEESTSVKEGEPILILEAMKMQNEINAHIGGKIKKIHVKQDDTVAKDELLLEIEK